LAFNGHYWEPEWLGNVENIERMFAFKQHKMTLNQNYAANHGKKYILMKSNRFG